MLFHKISVRFHNEVAKRYDINPDSLVHYARMAKHAALEAKHIKGMIEICLGLGSGHIDKYNIPSAKESFELAIENANAVKDTVLMARAYAGLGWALIYDSSNYEGSIQNLFHACELARASKDSSLINIMGTKLARVYFLKGDVLNAYKTSKELISICQARKDTTALIYNYYVFGSIFSDMGLFDKQMDLVYQALKLAPYISDTMSIYHINSTASNGYLDQHRYDSVLHFSRLNLPLARKLSRYPYCYTNIAMAFIESNQLDSARYYYEKILNDQKTRGLYVDTYLYLQLGKIEFRSGNRMKGIAYYKQAEAEITRPSLKTQKEIYKELHLAYKEMGNYQGSLDYLEKYNITSDSILSTRPAVTLGDYEAAVLEGEVKLLTKDKELQAARIAKNAQQEQVVYASISVLAFIAGFAFVRFRKQKNAKAKQELLNERLRISRELHDEVGGTLSGIAMYTHLAKDQMKKSRIEEADRSLSFMQKSASEMVTKLSDIVWLINPEQDTVAQLFDRLGDYAIQMAAARNMKVHIELPDTVSKLYIPMEARRNIYLFCKESISNAVKYSKGSYIKLQVVSTSDQYKFSVSDDGIGFDEIAVRKGNGLRNLQVRAEAIGATLHIESKPNQGSRINLQYKFIQ